MTITEQNYKKFVENLRSKEVDCFEHGVIGIVSEAGELANILKQKLVYKKPVDRVHVKEELGDLLHYMTYILNEHDLDLADIMLANMEKLKMRYPDGFNTKDALARRDKE